MRIAIDAGALTSTHKTRGIGRYTRELLRGIKIKGIDAFKEDLRKYDLVHFTSFKPFEICLPFAKPKKTKFVLTIYDLIPLIYPKNYPPGVRGKIKFYINKYLIKRHVDLIITISETSKKDICRLLGVNPDKIKVIYLAPRDIFKPINNSKALDTIKRKYDLPNNFVFYVGDVNYNKNIPTLIKACRKLKTPLVICGKQAKDIEALGMDISSLRGPRDWFRYLFGKPHPEVAHYKELLTDFKYSKDVVRLGFVPDKELVAIYNLASVYVQPSLYEGFGLPVLEALACGCSVVASKIQAHVEIAQQAVSYFNPSDLKDMVKNIKNPPKAGNLPREYSWRKTAKETLRAYKELLDNG
ncbi:glycosyltransferase family 4 protein [Patescibacteria group bacterium]